MGRSVGVAVGAPSTTGALVTGEPVGSSEGEELGDLVGLSLGLAVGPPVGTREGEALGDLEGLAEGLAVGSLVTGALVGRSTPVQLQGNTISYAQALPVP